MITLIVRHSPHIRGFNDRRPDPAYPSQISVPSLIDLHPPFYEKHFFSTIAQLNLV